MLALLLATLLGCPASEAPVSLTARLPGSAHPQPTILADGGDAGLPSWLAGHEPAPESPDRWLAWDKLWHFSASFVSVGAGYHLCANRLNFEHAPAAGISLGGSFSLGLGKELLDRYGHGRRFSWKDMAANALGIATGYFVFVHDY